MPLRLAFAKPVNVKIVSLTLELEDVRPNPSLHSQPVTARRLAEVWMAGDLDVGTFPIQLDGRIRITFDPLLSPFWRKFKPPVLPSLSVRSASAWPHARVTQKKNRQAQQRKD